MIARLINSQGQIVREWLTDRPDLALTADRNCTVGWRVEIKGNLPIGRCGIEVLE